MLRHIPGRKWHILAAFSFILGLNHLLWLSFASIVISTQEHFGVSELKANLLTLIYPVLFVLLSIYAGKLLDKHRYKTLVSYAAMAMLLGSIIRWLGAESYWLVFVGQFIIALTQPFITNATNLILSDWFAADKLATSNGLVSGGMFLATALGAYLPAPLIHHFGFSGMLLINMLITAIGVIYFLVVITDNKETHMTATAQVDDLRLHTANKQHTVSDTLSLDTMSSLIKNKRLWLISIIIFICMGYFNGLTNWISPLLAPRGIGEIEAGTLSGMLILGGIFGAFIIPMLSDHFKKRQIFLILSLLLGLVLTYPLLYTATDTSAIIISFILGFFLLAGYPIMIAEAENTVPPNQSGQAVAVMLMMGSLGGIAVVLAMQFVKDMSLSWQTAGSVLLGLLASAFVIVLFVRDKAKPVQE